MAELGLVDHLKASPADPERFLLQQVYQVVSKFGRGGSRQLDFLSLPAWIGGRLFPVVFAARVRDDQRFLKASDGPPVAQYRKFAISAVYCDYRGVRWGDL